MNNSSSSRWKVSKLTHLRAGAWQVGVESSDPATIRQKEIAGHVFKEGDLWRAQPRLLDAPLVATFASRELAIAELLSHLA